MILTPDLRSKNNTISVAISLEAGADQERGEGEERSRGAGAGQLTQIGSMLFTRGVSGTRVITGVYNVYTVHCSVHLITCDFCLRKELKKGKSSFVCSVEVCLELSIFIFLAQVSLSSLDCPW